MTKIIVGLDIGITSVGWAVTDEDSGKIIDAGVRLFKEGQAGENVKRRTFRSGRRLNRRRVHRVKDFVKLAIKEGLVKEDYEILSNPIELRVKGIRQKLSNEELFTALYHIVKKRGSSFEVVEDEKVKDEETAKASLSMSDKLIASGLYVCEIQLQRLEEKGHFKGSDNIFRTKHYEKEARQILNNQSVSELFVNGVIELINRRRHFSDGPGSMKSPSIYGRFIVQDDGSIEIIDLIEKMRGRCSIYPEHFRAPKQAPSAELFNILNDLNNLKVLNESIDIETKKDIIRVLIREDKAHSITMSKLTKHLNVTTEDIKGYRVNAKDEPIFSEFIGLKLVLKAVDESRHQLYLDNFAVIDEIMVILTSTKVIEERFEKLIQLQERLPIIHIDDIKPLSQISKIGGYHSLSLEAIYQLNNELFDSTDNQMQIIHRLHLNQLNTDHLIGLKDIPYDRTAILSPVAKRAQQEAIKVVNQIRKNYGEASKIFVELAREKNSDEKKSLIRKAQKNLETLNKSLQEIVGETEINSKTRLKLRLYKEQECKCVYTGECLNINSILSDPNAYDIDHIIPLSVSLDDSMANKVLVTNKANREKGNLTPLQAFRSNKFDGWSEESFRYYVSNLAAYKYGANKKKLNYLLDEREITSYSNMKDFIARNLVDTRYASRVVLNTLQDYFKVNQIPTRVVPINGKITAMLRGKIGIKKSRDENYFHHAIDAATLTLLTQQSHFSKVFDNILIENKDVEINTDGIPVYDYKDFLTESFMQKLVPLRELAEEHEFKDDLPFKFLESKIKISHKVDKKPNRSVSDQTIYSTRQTEEGEVVIKKYKDIYDPKFLTLAQDIIANKVQNKYLMAKHDPKTFEKLVEIVNQYMREFKELKENPFSVYYNNHGSVQKFSKKGNGPEIKSIAYVDGRLNSHIDISSKYEDSLFTNKQKRVVLQQISPYRTDFYVNDKNQYKFVTIRRSDVRYSGKKNLYFIETDWYQEQMDKKSIDKTYDFLFSMHRDELMYIEKQEKNIDGSVSIIKDIWKFTATNNDTKNTIEIKPIHYYEKKQLMPTIGKSIIKLQKLHTDILGKIYESKNNTLKLEFNIDKI
ncbi:MAG: type II CRISPR RNA-guided endonuclease Cas9 [Erysipelothrix sp.]|nr:type II CRISPR RNA-guided endonuclease Cas9 [Erysipelothrix sp.]